MGEALPHLCGEEETRISRDVFDPVRGKIRAQGAIKRCVDLDRVEELREIAGFVKSVRAMRGIEDAVPVRIRPAGRADENAVRLGGVRVSLFGHSGQCKTGRNAPKCTGSPALATSVSSVTDDTRVPCALHRGAFRRGWLCGSLPPLQRRLPPRRGLRVRVGAG